MATTKTTANYSVADYVLDNNRLKRENKQLQADKDDLKEQVETIRAGIMHYHNGKISLSQLMDFY